MATITVKINERSSMGKAIMELLKSTAKEKNIIEIVENPTGQVKPATNAKEEAFLKTLRRSAKHAREIGAGIRKGNSLEKLMNEL